MNAIESHYKTIDLLEKSAWRLVDKLKTEHYRCARDQFEDMKLLGETAQAIIKMIDASGIVIKVCDQ